MTPGNQERIIVLDFGSQYVQLIARRVREHHVYSQIMRYETPLEQIATWRPQAIILSGGPSSVYEPDAPKVPPALFDIGVPILGICYGMQLLCQTLGGKVVPGAVREYGATPLRVLQADPIFEGWPPESTVWMSHGDQVVEVSDDFLPLASTPNCPIAAVRHRNRPIYGLQFHPEVSHTEYGSLLVRNFLYKVCGCQGLWRMESFIERTIQELRQRIGVHRVICGLSGGVDSSVTAALLLKAVGPQVACIFVDNGLLRKGEVEAVRQTFGQSFHADLRVVDARQRFLDALRDVTDPQEKRRIIGHLFIEVFRTEAQHITGAKFLAQGTLYPDVIESGGGPNGPAATIKTHHNVGGLPADLGFELIEPLRDLFKDEVRQLGQRLGLPERLVWRHPFPGPGLAVRCIGAVTAERLAVLREADHIFLEELKKTGLYHQVSQAFAVLLPVQTVGVMGDHRTYEHVIALRAVVTEDFMTADWARLPYEFLARVATRIINEVQGVNRVVYDISSKPPATI
ncbi:MAG: glutamine-hydrolyzing GMP synthase, partial [Gemmatales bacterium]|nr:glutamine-hydrolyzing GMP synthase [Gemmatales bacterium]MDW8175694.1 glutamine-hydrolyzing GMP synthase [Gemmatales bacterium]